MAEDVFGDLRARVKGGGEELSDYSKREALLLLDTIEQVTKERREWRASAEEKELRLTAQAMAADNAVAKAIKVIAEEKARAEAIAAEEAAAAAVVPAAEPPP